MTPTRRTERRDQRSPNPLTVFVTLGMTRFVTQEDCAAQVSSNTKSYGYPRGAEPLARALPTGSA